MAVRRSFSLEVVDTDRFLDLPVSSQCLYFHLGMRADDDGFVPAPRRVAALVNASMDDIRILILKGFLIPFGSGVCVLRDWRVNNYIPRDRYHPSRFTEEKGLLRLDGENRYQEREKTEAGGCVPDPYTSMDTVCIQNGPFLYTDLYTNDAQKEIPNRCIYNNNIYTTTKEEYIPPIIPQKGDSTPKKKSRRPGYKAQPDWKPERFAKFWKFYPRGENKQAAIRAWDKLRAEDSLIDTMAAALVRQKKREDWKQGVGIPYASTWLNGRRWEDEERGPDTAQPEAPQPRKYHMAVIDGEEVVVYDD